MTGTVRVEGTGEPVAGARVRVDLGTRDLRGDFREAVTDADGRYSIPLPEGNARPLFFDPPPGYWLPDPGKHWKFFAVTPQQPVYRKDYLLRRGTAWTFRLTRGPKKEPVVHGFASTYQVPGDSIISVNARTDSRGEATLTLPDEAGKVGIILSAWDEGRVLLRMEWGHGIRPPWKGCSLEAGPERRIQLIDAAGGTVTIRGPVNVSTVDHPTLVTASLPEVDPGSYGRITGTVIDQEGRPIAGATVTIYFQHRQGGAIWRGMSIQSGPMPRAASSSARSRGRLVRMILASSRSWCTRTVMRAAIRTSSSSSRTPTGLRSWARFA